MGCPSIGPSVYLWCPAKTLPPGALLSFGLPASRSAVRCRWRSAQAPRGTGGPSSSPGVFRWTYPSWLINPSRTIRPCRNRTYTICPRIGIRRKLSLLKKEKVRCRSREAYWRMGGQNAFANRGTTHRPTFFHKNKWCQATMGLGSYNRKAIELPRTPDPCASALSIHGRRASIARVLATARSCATAGRENARRSSSSPARRHLSTQCNVCR
jgi:hypothetical protein